MKKPKYKTRDVQALIEAMRANGGHQIPDEPICYVLTELALEHLAELERSGAFGDGE